MADAPCSVGFKTSALQLAGTTIYNALGFIARMNVVAHEVYVAARITPCVAVDKVTNFFTAIAAGARAFVTPGTSGTSSATVLEMDSSTSATISCPNTIALDGEMNGEGRDHTWRQSAQHNAGGTETVNPWSVS